MLCSVDILKNRAHNPKVCILQGAKSFGKLWFCRIMTSDVLVRQAPDGVKSAVMV